MQSSVVLYVYKNQCLHDTTQDYKEKPDYGRSVTIVASASLREISRPGALAIVSPMAVGES
jgi:Na+/H+-translocating membrane pyrophosphatase